MAQPPRASGNTDERFEIEKKGKTESVTDNRSAMDEHLQQSCPVRSSTYSVFMHDEQHSERFCTRERRAEEETSFN